MLQQIELVTPVRETATAFIPIDNPTDTQIDIDAAQFVVTNENVSILPAKVSLPPNSEKGFNINFRPLIVSESTMTLLL